MIYIYIYIRKIVWIKIVAKISRIAAPNQNMSTSGKLALPNTNFLARVKLWFTGFHIYQWTVWFGWCCCVKNTMISYTAARLGTSGNVGVINSQIGLPCGFDNMVPVATASLWFGGKQLYILCPILPFYPLNMQPIVCQTHAIWNRRCHLRRRLLLHFAW